MTEYFILMKSELVVTAIIFLLLLVKLGKGMKQEVLLSLIQIALLINFIAGFFQNGSGKIFDGMFHTDAMIIFQKNILNLGVYIISLLFADWFRKCQHLAEFFLLMLSSLLGLDFLLSSGNFLMFFLSLELSTIPVAAMANFDLDKKRSSEAAMKMILSSAFSSGILLFGISLIYGSTGTINFESLPGHLTGSPLQVLAFVFLLTSFAFKLSVVPFHLWTADVYEGAPIAVTAFLSVISKGAVAFIFMSVLFKVFHPMLVTWQHMVILLSVLTMAIGNLFAIRQQNIKRFLAFSSIAQVGFILAAVSSGTGKGLAAVVFFVLVYVFSNLAAFGVAAVLSSQKEKENIDDYKGLYANNPLLGWVLAIALFSLAGIPPTAGFFGKLFLLSAGASAYHFWFILFAALNMIISLYYYLRVVKAVFIDKNDQPVEKLQLAPSTTFALILCTAGIILTGMLSWVYDYIQSLSI